MKIEGHALKINYIGLHLGEHVWFLQTFPSLELLLHPYWNIYVLEIHAGFISLSWSYVPNEPQVLWVKQDFI